MTKFSPSLSHLDQLDKEFIPSTEHLDKLDKGEDEDTGLSGVGNDILDVGSNLVSNFVDFATQSPENARKVAKSVKENPLEGTGHILGQLGAETAGIAKSAVNTPADVSNYLLKKHLHPAQAVEPIVQGLASSVFGKDNNEVSSSKDISNSLGKNVLQSNIKSFADQLIGSMKNLLPQVPEDTGVEKALGLEPNADKGDRLVRAIPDAISLAFGGRALVKSALKGGAKVSSLFNKEATQLKQAKDAENALKSSLETAKTATGDAQLKAAEEMSQQKGNLLQEHESKAAEVESMIPNEPESQIKKQTVEHFGQVRDQLKGHFDKEYNDYAEGPGSNPIAEPLSTQEVDSAISILNPNGRRMAEGLVPQQVELNILNPETKKPFVLEIPAQNGTVQDYIEMMRTARDARSKLKRDMEKPHVTRADELQMGREADALEGLQRNVEGKIQGSVTPEEWQQFQTIQNDYRDLYRPFMDNSHLFDAWFYKRDSGQIFKELNQPQYSRLFQSLHADPAFNQLALTSALRGKIHPLTDKNPVTQAKKIDTLLEHHNADLTRFMSPEQFASLKNLSTYGHLIGDADKGLQSLSKSLLSKATQALDIAKANKFNPRGEQLLKDIGEKQMSQKDINREMKKAGITSAEAKASFEARQHANQLMKKALSITGINKILNTF